MAINHDPDKGIIWLDGKGGVVEEKDAKFGEVWLDGDPVLVIPSKPMEPTKKIKSKQKRRKTNGKKNKV